MRDRYVVQSQCSFLLFLKHAVLLAEPSDGVPGLSFCSSSSLSLSPLLGQKARLGRSAETARERLDRVVEPNLSALAQLKRAHKPDLVICKSGMEGGRDSWPRKR